MRFLGVHILNLVLFIGSNIELWETQMRMNQDSSPLNQADFIQKFADCFQQTEPAMFVPELEFRKLDEWGSMLALIVIAMIDSDYGVSVSSADLKEAETVGQLYDLIARKQQNEA